MKTNVGALETIVTMGAEFPGDMVSFKWDKAAEALFSLRPIQVALPEWRPTAPGSEAAYIVKAMVKSTSSYDNVFINCPFDKPYKPTFNAIVFAIHDAGFIL